MMPGALALVSVCLPALWAPTSAVALARSRAVEGREEGGALEAGGGQWSAASALEEARGLRAVFEERHAAQVREAFAALTRPALLTVGGSVSRLLANFLLQAEAAAQASNSELAAVSAALDDATLGSCARVQQRLAEGGQLRATCLDLTHWLPPCPSRSAYLFVKPLVFREAVRASSHGVLMMDLDVVVYGDLLGWIRRRWDEAEESGRPLLMTAGEAGSCCNTGTVFATKESLPLMSLWVEENARWYRQDNLGDQRALAEVVSRNLTQVNASAQQILLIPGRVVLQECQKCRCSGGCRHCARNGPLALHYNCAGAHLDAEHDLSVRGDWADVDGLLGKPVKSRLNGARGWAAQACVEKK